LATFCLRPVRELKRLVFPALGFPATMMVKGRPRSVLQI